MNPPANWYPDPTGRHGQRYWDGQQWTEHVFTDGVQGVDPLEQAASPSSEDATADAEDRADDTAGAGIATGEAASGATGLFADAGSEDAWSPSDEDTPGDVQDDAVAPDVEADDVVASLDEVTDGPPNEVTTAVSDEEPDEEEDAGEEQPPAAGDMSDAFVLAPETASRIVKRRVPDDAEPPQPADAAEPTAPDAPPAADQATPSTGAIDAPPPTAAEPPPSTDAPAAVSTADDGDLGITGDLLGGAFSEQAAGPVARQNTRLLRCSVTPGEAVVARQGTMIAHQGEVTFERQGAGGVTRARKRGATGEGPAMLRAEGTGDVFFADNAQHVFLLELAGGSGLSVNGRNVLAFSAALQWDIERVKGATLRSGGLFNTTFTGNGWVALVSDGEPVVLHTDASPTHVDVNALVAWSAGLSTRIVSSGEASQMAFDGAGIVIVQPSEGPVHGAATG